MTFSSIFLSLNAIPINQESSKIKDPFATNNNISKPKTSWQIAWQNNGTILSNYKNTQDHPHLIPDDNGGAIIIWDDSRTIWSQYDIYAQKINSNGDTLWGNGYELWVDNEDLNGTVITNKTNSIPERYPSICSDNAGGAIIVWADDQGPFNSYEIYAQHIDSSGKCHWGQGGDLNGTTICNATGQDDDFFIRICSDGTGGAFIVWQDDRDDDDYFDIYAQHINSAGQTYWGENGDLNGTVICNQTSHQQLPQICRGGTNGAIIAWTDSRNNPPKGAGDIYAQYIDLNGKTYWGENGDLNGTVVCNATYYQEFTSHGSYTAHNICSDNQGGAIITWTDQRTSAITESDIYAQRIDSSGQTHWGENGDLNGTVICNTTEYEQDQVICSDNKGGAIIAWEKGVTDSEDIYAQLINGDGQTQWDTNGKIISNTPNWEVDPQVCSDKRGGAYIVWNDNYDIYVQWVNSKGIAQWKDNGELICNAEITEYMQECPQICSDEKGGAFMVWCDRRNSGVSGMDIYAQYISNPLPTLPSGGAPLFGGDDDDDDEGEDTGVFIIVIIIIVFASVAGGLVVIYVLIQKGIIDISKLKAKLNR